MRGHTLCLAMLLFSSGSGWAMQPLDDEQMGEVSGAGIGFFLDDFLYDQSTANARLIGIKDSQNYPVTIELEKLYVKGANSQRGALDIPAAVGTPLHPFTLKIVDFSLAGSLPPGIHALQLRTPTWTDPLNDTRQYGLWAYYQGCLYGEAGCTNPELAVTKIDGQLSVMNNQSEHLHLRYLSGGGWLALKQGIDADMQLVQTRQNIVDVKTNEYAAARTDMTNKHAAARNTGTYPKPALGEKYWCGDVCSSLLVPDVRAYNASVDAFNNKGGELIVAQQAVGQAWETLRNGWSLAQRIGDYNEYSALCGVPTSTAYTCTGGRIGKAQGDRTSLVIVSTALKNGQSRVKGMDVGFRSTFNVASTAWSGSSSAGIRGATTTRSDYFALDIEGFTLHGSYLNIWGDAEGLAGEISLQLHADKVIASACRNCTDLNRLVAKNVYLDINIGHGKLQPLHFSVFSDGELRFKLPAVTWANHQEFYAQVPKSNISVGNVTLSGVNVGAQAIRGLRLDYLEMRTVNLPR
jgi:hypothetical protein